MTHLSVRRGTLVVAVALLVAAAGCSGFSSSPTATPTDTASENATDAPTATAETPTEAGPTAEPTRTGGGEANASTPTGADLDGARLSDATADTLEAAGSYTARANFSTGGEGPQGEVAELTNTTTRVDFESSQGVRTSNRTLVGLPFGQNASTVVYTENDRSYQRQTTADGVNYSSQQGPAPPQDGFRPVNVDTFNLNLALFTQGLAWEENGTRTVDGVTATRYTLVGVTEASSQEGVTVTDASGTLLIDDDNVVRAASYAITTESDRGTSESTVSFRLTDVGSTTVEEPGWTSEARQTDSS